MTDPVAAAARAVTQQAETIQDERKAGLRRAAAHRDASKQARFNEKMDALDAANPEPLARLKERLGAAQ